MKQKINLISPNLIVLRDDLFTTGVVYMPIGMAYLASSFRSNNFKPNVIDSFGESPNQINIYGKFISRGLLVEEVLNRIEVDSIVNFVYAPNLTCHGSTVEIIKAINSKFPNIPTVVFENTQAVTAYSLRHLSKEFFDIGADYIITGEPEISSISIIDNIINNKNISIEGVISKVKNKGEEFTKAIKIPNLNQLHFPAWDLFPLKNYWSLGYAHGPLSTKKYLPILTSRGCPYPCKFCVVPETNDRKWRARDPKNVVDEMEYFLNNFGVNEYHIEDLNPTIKDDRIQEICKIIIERNLDFIWKISAGTKVESIRSEETVMLMAKSGCKYVSISPESGSTRIMKEIKKPFNYNHAINIISYFNKYNIYSQACFVLGFPGETQIDLYETKKMIKDLTKAGVDEVAQFIITPVPGSSIYEEIKGFEDYSELNFSPSWREDYKLLNKFRLSTYRIFLIWKFIYHPLKILKQPLNFLTRKFNTKMEMVPFRALHLFLIIKGIIGSHAKKI